MNHSLQKICEINGEKYISASVRPDGSVRKPIRIRPGHILQDEIPKYKASDHRKEKKDNEPTSSKTKSDSLVVAMENLKLRTENGADKSANRSRSARGRSGKRDSKAQQYRPKVDKSKNSTLNEGLEQNLNDSETHKSSTPEANPRASN